MAGYLLLHFGLVAALAVLALLLARSERTRELAHLAWVLVFVKLLVPAFLEVPVLEPETVDGPTFERAASVADAAFESTEFLGADLAAFLEPIPAAAAERDASALLFAAVLALWAVGALVCAVRIAVTLVRFRRLLRGARPPSASLSALAEEAATSLGLARSPGLRVVDARVSPALWPSMPATIVIPAGLDERLSRDEMRHVLLHELAHFARRDHWVRPLEALVQVAYWWLPPVVWMRGRLRAAEEACCDARVLRAGGDGSTYAGALIRAVEFLRGDAGPSSPLASSALPTGALSGRSLSDRITTIMLDQPRRPVGTAWRGLFALGLLCLVPLLPAPARAASSHAGPYVPPAPPVAGASIQSGDEPTANEDEAKTLRAAADLIAAGDLVGAAKVVDSARGPGASAALDLMAGNLALQRGELARAEQSLAVAVEKHPTFERAWRTLGVVRFQLRQSARAAEAFERAVRLGSDDAQTYGLYGMSLLGSGDARGAESALWLASMLEPDERKWKLGLLRSLLEQERHAHALTLADGMIAVTPEDVHLLRLVANAHIALGQTEEARQTLALAADLAAAQERILIAVTSGGEVFHGAREIGVAGVRAVVSMRLDAGEVPVVVQSESSAAHRVVQEVVGEALRAGAREVSVETSERRASGDYVLDGVRALAPPVQRRLGVLGDRSSCNLQPVYRPAPRRTSQLRGKGPGKVVVLLLVDEKGSVIDARVESSTDSAFEPSALEAVRRWRFEPGLSGGVPVPFRVRQTLRFPAEEAERSPDVEEPGASDPEEAPARAHAWMTVLQDGKVIRTYTEPYGAFRFSDLPPGSYTLRSELTPNFPGSDARVVVSEGGKVSLSFGPLVLD
ncbi:MAG: TonB family protein [Planctomycetota bacterium]